MSSEDSLCIECERNIFNESIYEHLFIADADDDDGDVLDAVQGGVRLVRSKDLLEAGSSKGCDCCLLLESTVSSLCHFTVDKDTLISIHIYAVANECGAPYGASTLFVNIEPHGCVRYTIFADEDDPAARYISTRDVDPNVASPAAFELAKRWMKDCLSNHEACLPPVPRLPTRVLDVSPVNTNVDLRLHQTTGVEGHYATLSYCWGVDQPMKTTRHCIAQYLQSMDPASLPKTIQDAIEVTRSLGIRFLWVDSMCIIQDSEEDKSRELQQMGHIFQNSQVCILAAAAETANDGFLDRPEGMPRSTYRLPYFRKGQREGSFKLREWTIGSDYDASEDPTSQRAWIFQERMLSQRLLIYPRNPHPLNWQCRMQRRTNGGIISNYLHSGMPSLPPDAHAIGTMVTFLQLPDKDLETYGRWWIWSQIVTNYTARRLTECYDRLPAISGVAAEFQKIWGGDYLAGLWAHNIVKGLLWRLDPLGVTLPGDIPPAPAPSWSWAACNQRVSHIISGDNVAIHLFHFEIESCQVAPLNASRPLGNVKYGILKVRALAKQAIWLAPNRWKSALADPADRSREVASGVADQFYPNQFYPLIEECVWCMPILDASKYPSFADTGLVLVRLGDRRFQRVGSLNVSDHDWFGDCHPTLFEIA